MWRVPAPEIDASALYQTCVNGTRDADLCTRLQLSRALIEQAYSAYVEAASSGQLHTFPVSRTIGIVTSQEMSAVYENRMVRSDAPGRPAYDMIMAAPLHGRCPLCGHRRVSTLDHHLPQSQYAALAIYPLNLVPSCKDCNTTKKHMIPTTEGDSTLHPYFDNVEDGRWLRATLSEGRPPAVRFRPDPPEAWSRPIKTRIRHHFSTFRLGQLYALEAADELRVIELTVKMILQAGGADAVRAHLYDEAERCNTVRPNWWRTALYESLAESNWYCEGSFLQSADN